MKRRINYVFVALGAMVVMAMLAAVGFAYMRYPVPLYQNRSIVPATGVWGRLLAYRRTVPRALAANHPQYSERALLIRNPDYLAGFRIADLVVKGAAVGGSAASITSEALLHQWLATYGPIYPGLSVLLEYWPSNQSIDQIPLSLVAITNRLDMAQVSPKACPGMICGAEVHFTYAGKASATDPFSIIVEFRLPPMNLSDFKSYAQSWDGLGSVTEDQYLHCADPKQPCLAGRVNDTLGSVQTANLPRSARIRTVGTNDVQRSWFFGEFEFQASGLAAVPLFRQPGPESQRCLLDTTSDLGAFLSNAANVDAITAADYTFPSPVTQCQAMLLGAQSTVTGFGPALQLASTVQNPLSPQARDDLRFAVSINSCTGCHGIETHTDFDHVVPPRGGRGAALSRFLTGCPPGNARCKPGDPATGEWLVRARTCDPGMQSCTCDPAAPRNYNDLWRRHLYLNTVIGEACTDATDTCMNQWKDDLYVYGLIALQGH